MGNVAADLAAIQSRVARKGAKAGADAMGNKFVQLTLPHVPYKSGALRRSIRVHPGGGGLRSTSSAAPHEVYAAIQNFGGVIVAKHTFTTKTGKVLRGYLHFENVFARKVKIPGQGYWTLAGKEGACIAAAEQAIARVAGG